MEHFIDYEKVIGVVIATAALGGGLAVISGRTLLRKWLLNGTEDHITEMKGMLETVIEAAGMECPVIERGKTPLSVEEHKVICDNQRLLTQKENELVLEKIKNVDEKVERVLEKIGG